MANETPHSHTYQESPKKLSSVGWLGVNLAAWFVTLSAVLASSKTSSKIAPIVGLGACATALFSAFKIIAVTRKEKRADQVRHEEMDKQYITHLVAEEVAKQHLSVETNWRHNVEKKTTAATSESATRYL